ncbi:MAG TPA: SUMF1/EgtB/PvdO family nonheme iron enzyme [Pyrinomonadaceae bacterium]|jgi:iron(II)-dependent oxidoreductase|nr:SUMF1/EgtB/PvdO family nonheme iron enzyme [Pyrinomonadaceae bacterium]
MNGQAEQIALTLTDARAATLRLFDLAAEGDLRESPGFGYRPILWHLAHIGVFEAYWLLQKVGGRPAPDERYERIFDPIKTPREESKSLPTRREMETYLRRVREGALECLDRFDFDSGNPLKGGGYVFRLVLEHERQHQETLAYLFQLLDPLKKTRPDMILVPEGAFEMGATRDSFAYDNERPAHAVFVPSFRIARVPVTNEEYARFIAEGGYERREFWTDEGWTWKEKEGWASPFYWRRDGAGGWVERRMFDEGAVEPEHPVTGVSWYESQAYARFAGKRLPTEAEWEKAASWDGTRKRRYAWGDGEPNDALCNFNLRHWGTTPVGGFDAGASACGCLDMSGNVWEWTSTPFEGFPGFEPFPYPEYSEVWFDGDHRVLKGGSWATHASVLRTSFRNFFRRHFRIAFAGLRLAEDA